MRGKKAAGLVLVLCGIGIAVAAFAESGSPAPAPAPAPAPTPAPSVEEIEGWVRSLGDDAFQVREEAYRRLLEIGMRHPDRVLSCLPEQPSDLEVQARCQSLRSKIGIESLRHQGHVLAGDDPAARKAIDALIDFPTWDHPDHPLYGPEERDRDFTREGVARKRFAKVLVATGWDKPTAASYVVRFLEADGLDPAVPWIVMELLAELGQEGAGEAGGAGGGLLDRLIAYAERIEPEPSSRPAIRCEMAIRCLARAEDADRLFALLDHPFPALRDMASSAIQKVAGPGWTDRILSLLKDEQSDRRALGASLVRNCPDPVLVRPLARLLEDKDAQVRRAAADALGKLKDPSTAAVLAARLKDEPDNGARQMICAALADIGRAEEAVPAARPLLGHANSGTRAEAARMLGRFKDRDSIRRIAALLDDAEPCVRNAAAEALGHFAGEDWTDPRETIVSVRTTRFGTEHTVASVPEPHVAKARAWWMKHVGEEVDNFPRSERKPLSDPLGEGWTAIRVDESAIMERNDLRPHLVEEVTLMGRLTVRKDGSHMFEDPPGYRGFLYRIHGGGDLASFVDRQVEIRARACPESREGGRPVLHVMPVAIRVVE